MAELFNIRLEVDLSEFDATVVDGGDLSQAAAAALAGSAGGMQCVVDDTTAIYGQKNISPSESEIIRFRLYVDPNSLTMANADQFVIGVLRNSAGANMHLLFLRYDTATGYALVTQPQSDAGGAAMLATPVTDAQHYVEVLIQRASSAVAGDGRATTWIDGTQVQNLTTLDNYDLFGPGSLRVGAISGLDAGTSGTFYVDEIRGNDDGGTIGPRTAVPVFIRHYRNMRT